jgi:hypothetical protein
VLLDNGHANGPTYGLLPCASSPIQMESYAVCTSPMSILLASRPLILQHSKLMACNPPLSYSISSLSSHSVPTVFQRALGHAAVADMVSLWSSFRTEMQTSSALCQPAILFRCWFISFSFLLRATQHARCFLPFTRPWYAETAL